MALSKSGRRRITGLLILLAALVLGLNQTEVIQLKTLAAQLEQNQPGTYTVLEVSDGDTIKVLMNAQAEDVRFIGVDTPELHHPKKPVQCFGEAARRFNLEAIAGQNVRLVADPLDDNRDIYGRLLRYVYLPDGRLLNAELIAGGYGFAYRSFPFEKKEQFIALENTARAAKRGLWQSCQLQKDKYGELETSPA